MILIPVLSRVLPISSVPAALSIGTATNSLSRLVAFRKSIRWDIVRNFVPASIPAVWLGAWLLQYCNPMYLELLMGLFLVSNIAQEFVWHEGFEIENVITLADLPAEKRAWVESAVHSADSYVIKEVFSLREHAYELYLEKDGKVEKVDF